MRAIKSNLKSIFTLGVIIDVVGLALLITNVIEDVSVGLTIFAIGLITIGLLLEVAVVLIWLTPRILEKLLGNRGSNILHWEDGVLTLHAKLLGVTIGSTRFHFNCPFTVTQGTEDGDWTVNLP